MSNTVRIPGIRKFFKDLRYKERIAIQRRMEVSIVEAMTPGSPYMDELAVEMVYVAARRLNRDDVTHDSLEAMNVEDFDFLTNELLETLGFEDDLIEVDDDGVPLVMKESKNESSEKQSETGNSLTSTTDASKADGE